MLSRLGAGDWLSAFRESKSTRAISQKHPINTDPSSIVVGQNKNLV